MGEFGTKYTKCRPTKDPKQNPATNNFFGIQKEKNAIVQHAVDEIILQENKQLGVKVETHNKIDDEVDEDELYEIYKTILDEKK